LESGLVGAGEICLGRVNHFNPQSRFSLVDLESGKGAAEILFPGRGIRWELISPFNE
jgi:hypothetical protein